MESQDQLELSTNGGELHTNLQATVKGFGEVWFHPKAITNIFSFAEIEDRHPITYDSRSEQAFILHLPDKEFKLTRSLTDFISSIHLTIQLNKLVLQIYPWIVWRKI
jgi:hypothetical protein